MNCYNIIYTSLLLLLLLRLSSNDYIKLTSIYVYEYLLTSVTMDYRQLLSVVIDYFCGTQSHKKVNYWLL